MKLTVFGIFILLLFGCSEAKKDSEKSTQIHERMDIPLDIAQANRLIKLPLECIQNPLPYKSGHIIETEADLAMPIEHHPAFYGCFDWHSAVHGHWSLVYLLKSFKDIEGGNEALSKLKENLSAANILKEVDYFTMNTQLKSFERTYGWAWLLKLQEELYTWDHPDAKGLYENIQPLADYISKAYINYLPKLAYPIRVGEHSNTGFGLSFAFDYAETTGDKVLMTAIKTAALRFYSTDKSCPISWEPSGYDFLSPCLQEADIMRKVLGKEAFAAWLAEFLPELNNGMLVLEPGRINDRTDGKMVHLDGLNFSRAWCLYALKENNHALAIADNHLDYSLKKITDGDYAGQHWLASFALYAFKQKEGK